MRKPIHKFLRGLYFLLVIAFPLMILGFVLFSVTLLYLGKYVSVDSQEDSNAISKQSPGTFYVCQASEDSEGVRFGD